MKFNYFIIYTHIYRSAPSRMKREQICTEPDETQHKCNELEKRSRI